MQIVTNHNKINIGGVEMRFKGKVAIFFVFCVLLSGVFGSGREEAKKAQLHWLAVKIVIVHAQKRIALAHFRSEVAVGGRPRGAIQLRNDFRNGLPSVEQ